MLSWVFWRTLWSTKLSTWKPRLIVWKLQPTWINRIEERKAKEKVISKCVFEDLFIIFQKRSADSEIPPCYSYWPGGGECMPCEVGTRHSP
ncbi:hypothetical protein KSP39_PZI015317 [Platanthera zijinensis]|uniref:Uncharacterized protein n=1 Tax=Platanthera zijinensis TaxID=2320716 RepID=A0AAP0G1U8_9ASPA